MCIHTCTHTLTHTRTQLTHNSHTHTHTQLTYTHNSHTHNSHTLTHTHTHTHNSHTLTHTTHTHTYTNTHTGKLVLFTAPEDMIIGRACHVYEKEITSKYAARDLRTTSGLMGSALGYSPENDLQVYLFSPTGTIGQKPQAACIKSSPNQHLSY